MVGGAAKIMGVAKTTIYNHYGRYIDKVVDGYQLYRRDVLEAKQASRKRLHGSRLTITGVNVERVRRICEAYYRTQFDVAPPELKALAKRIAML
jgi:hypothetical protein